MLRTQSKLNSNLVQMLRVGELCGEVAQAWVRVWLNFFYAQSVCYPFHKSSLNTFSLRSECVQLYIFFPRLSTWWHNLRGKTFSFTLLSVRTGFKKHENERNIRCLDSTIENCLKTTESTADVFIFSFLDALTQERNTRLFSESRVVHSLSQIWILFMHELLLHRIYLWRHEQRKWFAVVR